MLLLQNLWNFTKSNSERFVWELVSVAVSAALGYGVSYLVDRAMLEACQHERTDLLNERAAAQAVSDSLKWSGRLSLEKAKTKQLLNENSKLREQRTLDSLARMSELETLQSINQRYRKP